MLAWLKYMVDRILVASFSFPHSLIMFSVNYLNLITKKVVCTFLIQRWSSTSDCVQQQQIYKEDLTLATKVTMLALVVYKHGVTWETDLICHVQWLCFSKKQKDGFCRSTENLQEVNGAILKEHVGMLLLNCPSNNNIINRIWSRRFGMFLRI